MERTVGLMPRRNRNSGAARIDYDRLADSISQLETELLTPAEETDGWQEEQQP